jgi:hypothetical protein
MARRDVLETLFGSQVKVRLMRLFLLNPAEIFDMKTISSRLGSKVPVIQKELKPLFDIGYIKKGTRIVTMKGASKNKLVRKRVSGFGISRDFPYINELAALLASSAPAAREKMLARVKGIGKVNLLVMAGQLLGYDTERVDIFIVGDGLKKSKIEHMLNTVEADTGKEIIYALMPTKEFQYRYGMYDRFIKDLFDNPHEILVNKLGIG